VRRPLHRLWAHLSSMPRRELPLLGGAAALSMLIVIAYVVATRPNELAGDQLEYHTQGVLPTFFIIGASKAGTTSLRRQRERLGAAHSHSIVAGGFDETSRATRLTPPTSLMIRLETRSSRS
jgi:hypothetical protein